MLRDCSAPQPGDRIAILPSITTRHSGSRFPFCLANFPCDGPMGEQFRALSSLNVAPMPALWAVTTTETPGAFAILPPLTSGSPIELVTKLATGEVVEVQLTAP